MRNQPIVRRALLSLGFFLLAAPVFLLFGGAAAPDDALLWLLPLLSAAVLAFLVRLLPGRIRVMGMLLSMLLAAGSALALGLSRQMGAVVAVPMILSAAAVAVHVLMLSGIGADQSITVWYVGMVMYVTVRVICAVMALRMLYAPLRLLFLCYVSYVIFALAVQSLREGVAGRRGPSRLMLARNLGMALALVLALWLLSHLPQLLQALRSAVNALKGAFAWLLEHLNFLNGASGGGGGGGGMDLSMLAGETAEPSPFMVFLEKAVQAVGVALALAAAGLLLLMIFRALKRALRALLARIRAYAGAVSDAYEDTVESLLDWGEVQRAVRERRDKARRAREDRIPWEQLDPRQRVRRCFRNYLARHPEIPPQRTARQEIREKRLADIYEAARYSSREIGEREAEDMRALK